MGLKYEYEAVPYYLVWDLGHFHMTLNNKMPLQTLICLNAQRTEQTAKSRGHQEKKKGIRGFGMIQTLRWKKLWSEAGLRGGRQGKLRRRGGFGRF